MFVSRIGTCVVITVLGAVMWAAPSVSGAGDVATVASVVPYEVTLEEGSAPTVLLRAPDRGSMARRPVSGDRTFRPAQDEFERIEFQQFEGDTFPPEGWTTWDNDNRTGGPDETYTWGTQDCDIPTDSLGLKAAWSVGGGRLGQELLCAGNYDQPARSWLLRTEIDSSDYPGGIQVNMRFKVDLPRDEAFEICGSTERPTTIACSHAVAPTPGRWLTFRDPIVFDRAGGLTDAVIILRYVDESPDGGNIGVFIDDLIIEGVLGEAPPTVTPTPEDEPSPGPTASRPVPTADPGGPRVFMPLAVNNHDLQFNPVPPTASPGRLTVEFAEDFLEDGTAVNPGPRFAYGVLQLCAKQSWFDTAVGTTIRREWSEWDGTTFLPLGGPDLNSAVDVPSPNGFSEQCVQWVDEADGSPVPVPAKRYRVQLFHGASTSPSASGDAEILAAEPGTPEPTAEPTGAATPEPTVAPTPEPGDCFDPVENGDFEAGPGEGWIERTVAEGGIIRTERTFDGSEYGALFGTVFGIQEVLQSRRPIPNRAADVIEAATLSFVLLMVSEETPGGEETDIFGVCVGGDTTDDVECIARASEDTWPAGRWVPVEQDVTDFFVTRDGFTNSSLLFIAQTDATLGTNFAMDNVQLELCLTGGERVIVPIDVGSGLPMGGVDGLQSYSLDQALDASAPRLRRAEVEPAIGIEYRWAQDRLRWLTEVLVGPIAQ